MKIVISANCQTYGISAALSAMCDMPPPVCIQNIGVPAETLREQLVYELENADAFIYANNNAVGIELASQFSSKLAGLKVPVVSFHAFHPDLCYAYHRQSLQFTRDNYNSVIALWAYTNNLAPERTAMLYRAEVYAALGYFDAWPAAVRQMQAAFDDSDFKPDFREFYLAVKREGCFMHTVNHPRLPVLMGLSKLIIRRLGLEVRREISPGQINDNLNGQIWPIYPEIAEHLALEGGSYVWKYIQEGRSLSGVRQYLDAKFEDYRQQGHTPDTLQFVPSTVQFLDSMERADAVLKNFVEIP